MSIETKAPAFIVAESTADNDASHRDEAAQQPAESMTDFDVAHSTVETIAEAPDRIYTYTSSEGHTYSGTSKVVRQVCSFMEFASDEDFSLMSEALELGAKLEQEQMKHKKVAGQEKDPTAPIKSESKEGKPHIVVVKDTVPGTDERLADDRPVRFVAIGAIKADREYDLAAMIEQTDRAARTSVALKDGTSYQEQLTDTSPTRSDPRTSQSGATMQHMAEAWQASAADIRRHTEDSNEFDEIGYVPAESRVESLENGIQTITMTPLVQSISRVLVETPPVQEKLTLTMTPDYSPVNASQVNAALVSLSAEQSPVDGASLSVEPMPAPGMQPDSYRPPWEAESWKDELFLPSLGYELDDGSETAVPEQLISDALAGMINWSDLSWLVVDHSDLATVEIPTEEYIGKNREQSHVISPESAVGELGSGRQILEQLGIMNAPTVEAFVHSLPASMKTIIAETTVLAMPEMVSDVATLLTELAEYSSRLDVLKLSGHTLSEEAIMIEVVILAQYERLIRLVNPGIDREQLVDLVDQLRANLGYEDPGTHEKKQPRFNLWPIIQQASLAAHHMVVGKVALSQLNLKLATAAWKS